MRLKEYSHRHGAELLQLIQPEIHTEVLDILKSLSPFAHGAKTGQTVKTVVTDAFCDRGWTCEWKAELSNGKHDFVDLYKQGVAIEMEWSRFEMFFRDFFRMMLLYEHKHIQVGIILTYDEMAYQRWTGEAKPYKSARASLERLVGFLNGEYASVVRVPLWCIGIE